MSGLDEHNGGGRPPDRNQPVQLEIRSAVVGQGNRLLLRIRKGWAGQLWVGHGRPENGVHRTIDKDRVVDGLVRFRRREILIGRIDL